MSGEWLTLGDGLHKCSKPSDFQVEMARAKDGALWRCSECGLVWELEKVFIGVFDATGQWVWKEYAERVEDER